MKFNHLVKHNGVYYPVGTEVPIGDTPVIQETSKEDITKEQIEVMSNKALKELATEKGLEFKANISNAKLREMLIDCLGL